MNIEKSSALLVIDIQQEDFMEMNESMRAATAPRSCLTIPAGSRKLPPAFCGRNALPC